MKQINAILQEDFSWFLAQSRPPRLRTMREFAEQEIVIPDGPFEGMRYACDRQPYTALWFEAVQSGRWNRFVATGPTQSGKTLSCFIIPLLYHLFEVGETVICGIPDMDMALDKWREDLLPVIERSRYRHLMPVKGQGSRGGPGEAIQFRHGATLRFMSGGGGDKSRAGFTSRVVVVTETDGMDQPGVSSRESDKITQLEARTRAWGSRKRIYLECTVSTVQGRTWQEYSQGTASRILLPCPHCSQWVSPEREHLQGWQQAESSLAAASKSHFVCPECAASWTEQERILANQRGRLLHSGQSLSETGELLGEAPGTATLGFRWSGVNNLFLTAGDLATDEWNAIRAADEESAEKALKQFVWCLPVAAGRNAETALEIQAITQRVGSTPQGIVPAGTEHVTAAIDLGKYLAHWVAVAWGPGATGHLIDYGRLEVPCQDLGLEQALLVTLRQFRDLVTTGWPSLKPGSDSEIEKFWKPEGVFVDAGYMTDVVYAFCREAKDPFRPSVGRGTTQRRTQWYNRPTNTGSVVKHIGEGYHLNWLPSEQLYLTEVDADHWKGWVHQRLASPLNQSGSLRLFQAPPSEHLSLAKHLTAERKIEEFVAGKGLVVRWEAVRRQNHWFDALYNACAAGHLVGVRLIAEPKPPPPPKREPVASFLPPAMHEQWEQMMGRYSGNSS